MHNYRAYILFIDQQTLVVQVENRVFFLWRVIAHNCMLCLFGADSTHLREWHNPPATLCIQSPCCAMSIESRGQAVFFVPSPIHCSNIHPPTPLHTFMPLPQHSNRVDGPEQVFLGTSSIKAIEKMTPFFMVCAH